MSGRKVREILVDYVFDDGVSHDTWYQPESERLNVKIIPDGRGYVKTAEVVALYANVQRIVVRRDGKPRKAPR